MPLHRSIDDLQLRVREPARALMTRLGAGYYIYETFREQVVQDAYYAQGRESLATVNTLRKVAGLWEITDKQNTIITKAKHSRHTDGVALDIIGLNAQGRPTWDMPAEFWQNLATEATKLGFSAGYLWKDFPDPPHIEYTK